MNPLDQFLIQADIDDKNRETVTTNIITVSAADYAALLARLAAAEKVCLMFGWTGAQHDTDRGKAAHELWVEWLDISGVSTDPAAHPELSDEKIAELAARRDAKRAAALERGRKAGILP